MKTVGATLVWLEEDKVTITLIAGLQPHTTADPIRFPDPMD